MDNEASPAQDPSQGSKPPPQPPPLSSGVPPLIEKPPGASAHASREIPPRRARRRSWLVLAVLFLTLIGWGLFKVTTAIKAGAKHFAHGVGGHAGGWLTETVLEDNGSKNKVVVIEVSGIIADEAVDHVGHSFVDRIEEELDLAAEDDQVKAVVLKIDSPGGEVLASDRIYRAIREFQKSSRKPVVAVMGSVAASGGYYVAAPCRWIIASELTITGSIGVIMHSYNYRGLMDKVGVRPEVYKSGKLKDMMSGDRLEVSVEEKQMLQALIDETYQRFRTVVEEGRNWAAEKNSGEGRKLADDWTRFADGRIVSGKQAREIGLVDELGDYKDALEKTMELAGISDANVVGYAQPFEFGSLFKMFGKAESKSIKLDLGIEWPKLHVGRLYYVSGHLFGGP